MNTIRLSEVIKLTGWTDKEFAQWLFANVRHPQHKLKRVLAGEAVLSVSEERAIEELVNKTIVIATTDMNFTPSDDDIMSFKHQQFVFNWSKSTGIGLLMSGKEIIENQILIKNGTNLKELEELLIEKVNLYKNKLNNSNDAN